MIMTVLYLTKQYFKKITGKGRSIGLENRSVIAGGGEGLTVHHKGILWLMELSCVLFVLVVTRTYAGVKTHSTVFSKK